MDKNFKKQSQEPNHFIKNSTSSKVELSLEEIANPKLFAISQEETWNNYFSHLKKLGQQKPKNVDQHVGQQSGNY